MVEHQAGNTLLIGLLIGLRVLLSSEKTEFGSLLGPCDFGSKRSYIEASSALRLLPEVK